MWQAFKKWFFQMGSPYFFYEKSKAWIFYSGIIGMILLVIGLIWGLGFAPPDYQQGNSFRIIYIHVPAASLAMSTYILLAIWGLIFLVWRIKMVDILSEAAIPIGGAMTFIALMTGAIWGIPTWGTAFAADARIISMAFLLFLYIGLFLVRTQLKPLQKAQQLACLLALIGVINIPIIKYSVEWVTTLHQGATFSLTEKPKMPPSMYLPLLFAILGSYLLNFCWILSQARRIALQKEFDKNWAKQYLKL